MPGVKEKSPESRKRKLDDGAALEIDLAAPEPPSKKALRKAKKKGDTKAEPVEELPAADVSEQTEAAEKPQKQRSNFGIWIGNLPFTATKDDLRSFLTNNGSIKNRLITRLHMPEGPGHNRRVQNKGFAYVDFATNEAMEQAIALSEQLLNGRRVLIKGSNNFEGRPDKPADKDEAGKSSKGPVNPPSNKIFVGNLSFDVTKEMLEGHFAPCGTVSHIHMATFEDSGKCKGFAWVEFEDVEAAKAAVRGFVNVDESDEEESSESESESEDLGQSSGSDDEKSEEKSKETKKKETKKKQKRIWVNRIAGRQMRMEFAEDKATRYKKRFGKEGSGKDRSGEGREQESGKDAPPIEEVPTEKPARTGKKGKQEAAGKSNSKNEKQGYRYTQDVVQRLSGAMVEGQGKKTTFD